MLRYLLIPLLLLCCPPFLMAADEETPPIAEQAPSEQALSEMTGTNVDNTVVEASPEAADSAAPAEDTPVQEEGEVIGGDQAGDAGDKVTAATPAGTDLAASDNGETGEQTETTPEEEVLAEEEFVEPLPSGNMISISTAYNTHFDAYAVGPEDAEYSVLLVHDEWGLNDEIKLRANEIAALGYRALAIDLYDGRIAYDEGLAHQVRQAIDPVWVDSDLKAALAYLKMRYSKVVVIGWGYGAEQSLNLTINRPNDIAATIFYYGEPIEDVNALSAIQGPLFGIFANRSDKIDVEKVATFRDTMLALHKTFFMMRFDALDGFANPLADTYNERAAGAAWQAIQEFLVYSIFRY